MKEEFIILLKKFLQEDITSEELGRLHQLYEKLDVDEKLLSDYYRAEWTKVLDSGTGENYLQDEDKSWKALQKHMHPHPLARLNKWQSKWVQTAAVIIIAVLFTGIGYSISSLNERSGKDLIVKVDNGQKAQVELPDGSTVWLNAASCLSYSTDFNKSDRIVNLIGEACFEVARNPDKTFIVQTHDGLEIKALGTKFNVKSYPEDESTTSTLLEGKIQISNSFISEILKPNEQLVFKRQDRSFLRKEVKEQETSISWMNNKLYFEEETLGSIANTLKRLYNVEVIFESARLKDIIYSGKIKNNKLENVLELITTVSPVAYTLQGDVVTFKEKSKKPD